MSLAVFGEIGLDLLLDSDARITPRIGGAGLYAAMAAAKQGLKIDFFTVYGPEIEQYSLKFWKVMGISTQQSLYLDNYSVPRYLVTGYKAFEHKNSTPMTDVKMGVNYNPSLNNECKGLLLFPLDHSFPESMCRHAFEKGIPIFLDPKPNDKSIKQARGILKYVTVLLVNEEEALLLSESLEINEAIRKIEKMGPKYTIIKRGHKGCILVQGEKTIEIPAYKSNVVCTLGSGDAFGGALAATFLETGDIEYSVQIANCVAANFIESFAIETLIDKAGVEKDIHYREKFIINEASPKRIYLAGPFFSKQELDWVRHVENRLENARFTILSPSRENGVINNDTSLEQRYNIFQSDINLLNSADIVIALLDHDDPGTCFEIGYAFQKKIPVYGYKTSQKSPNNMIQFGCVQTTDNIEELIRVLYEQK
ncbi:PfkB family carbohydrate kinase [Paenibacillus senegalimassiliensis]|uniref:PfkB family carbohydrate kinase n=1 Tax=Paenibacillus senegalimassiliensis TaxID=1737426 RepID=UPI00073E5A96|nr:PfkB family carbohydrate kinase [Paenibacillus senegalimassiliensis]